MPRLGHATGRLMQAFQSGVRAHAEAAKKVDNRPQDLPKPLNKQSESWSSSRNHSWFQPLPCLAGMSRDDPTSQIKWRLSLVPMRQQTYACMGIQRTAPFGKCYPLQSYIYADVTWDTTQTAIQLSCRAESPRNSLLWPSIDPQSLPWFILGNSPVVGVIACDYATIHSLWSDFHRSRACRKICCAS